MIANADITTLSTALLCSAGDDRVAVVLGLTPAWPGAHAIGPAFTVYGSGGDNLALYRAVMEAALGDVIVLDVGGHRDTAHCGALVARAALMRGIHGIVINGSIRDRAAIAELRFPVFHDGTSPRKPSKIAEGKRGVTITLAGVAVHPGDLVCADDDGVAVVPAGEIEAIVTGAAALDVRERAAEDRIVDKDTALGAISLSGQTGEAG